MDRRAKTVKADHVAPTSPPVHMKMAGYVVGPTVAFVPHPDVPQCWFKTYACVMAVGCVLCKSPPGTPCTEVATGRSNWIEVPHVPRRKDARGAMVEVAPLRVIIPQLSMDDDYTPWE